MKVALAQINPIVGDFEYNFEKILRFIKEAENQNADLMVFSELVICGYPPKDLLLKKQFVEDNEKYLKKIAISLNTKISVVLGFVEENKGLGKPLFDSVALIQNKKVIHTRQKILLPTYDVFDEERYFEPGKSLQPVEFSGKKIGLTVCEDIWHDDLSWTKPRYHLDPITELLKNGTQLLINISASPYFIDKPELRETILKNIAKKYKLPIIYVNQVGGNDELVFDGNSCVINKDGNVCIKLKAFEEDLQFCEINNSDQIITRRDAPMGRLHSNENEELLQALICGLRDYINKCGFRKVVIGISGGIDSALTATIATYALGKENVLGILMPSRYTSRESINDAFALTKNLEIDLKTISIEESFKTFINLLKPHLEENKDLINQTPTEENIQARIRGLILMAISNQTRALVLSTGNKSELATGYCTLYGDMCGGLALISDLPKTTVYKLTEYINQKEGKELIPKNIITKAPTAELKENQKDQDTLPPYDILDKILNLYVEEHKPVNEIIKNGLPKEIVNKICNMIDSSEYKRQQAAPGLKLTSRSFGYGWRMPIAQRYKESI